MRLISLSAFGLLLALGACTASPRTASTQMAPASPGSTSAAPEPANSLPRGDVVNAPRTPATGTISTTRPY